MALVPFIRNAIRISQHPDAKNKLVKELKELSQYGSGESGDQAVSGSQWSAFPKKLADELKQLKDKELTRELHLFPAVLEAHRSGPKSKLDQLYHDLKKIGLGDVRKYTYYAILKSDGDRMGKLLSGGNDGTDNNMCYGNAFHSDIYKKLKPVGDSNVDLNNYLQASRLSSPGRHMSISGALSTFSSKAAPYLIEHVLSGKVIYSGGDDLLAFLPVDDVLPALYMLKNFYQGTKVDDNSLNEFDKDVKLGNGWAMLDGQLSLCMGSKATISAGVVIAHYSHPILAVLRELDEAERTAKSSGRDAFCIRVLKRSGGEESVVASFDPPKYQVHTSDRAPAALMHDLLDQLEKRVSRRALFIARSFLEQLPPPDPRDVERMESWRDMITSALTEQLGSEMASYPGTDIRQLCSDLVTLALATQSGLGSSNDGHAQPANKYLTGLLGVVEFIARYQNDVATEIPEEQDTGEAVVSQ